LIVEKNNTPIKGAKTAPSSLRPKASVLSDAKIQKTGEKRVFFWVLVGKSAAFS
jgi:hypothetical protein